MQRSIITVINLFVVVMSTLALNVSSAERLPVIQENDSLMVLNVALKYAGFDKLKNYNRDSVTIDTLTLSNYGAPISLFLSREVKTWRVKFKNVRLDDSKSILYDDVKFPDEFDVYINYWTGQLVKIESNYVGDTKDNFCGNYKSDHFGLQGNENDIPLSTPKLSYVDILKNHRFGKIAEAERYIAYYYPFNDPLDSSYNCNVWYVIFWNPLGNMLDILKDRNDESARQKYSAAIINGETGWIIMSDVAGSR